MIQIGQLQIPATVCKSGTKGQVVQLAGFLLTGDNRLYVGVDRETQTITPLFTGRLNQKTSVHTSLNYCFHRTFPGFPNLDLLGYRYQEPGKLITLDKQPDQPPIRICIVKVEVSTDTLRQHVWRKVKWGKSPYNPKERTIWPMICEPAEIHQAMVIAKAIDPATQVAMICATQQNYNLGQIATAFEPRRRFRVDLRMYDHRLGSSGTWGEMDVNANSPKEARDRVSLSVHIFHQAEGMNIYTSRHDPLDITDGEPKLEKQAS